MPAGYWYLASPYSLALGGPDVAHETVCREAARLIRAGIPVLSPIAHSHAIALLGEIDPLDHDIWLPVAKPMMDAAIGLIVLEMDGWEQSRGVRFEIEVFSAAGKPIIHMTPGVVPEYLLC